MNTLTRSQLKQADHNPRRTRIYLISFWLLITGFWLLMTGCDVRSVDPVVKIGVVAPFEGTQRQVGYDILYSARLAVREINAAGGINGTRVSLVLYDDSTFPEEAKRVAQALIVDDAVVAVLGHWSIAATEAASGLYNSAELPFIPMGEGIFGVYDSAALPDTFRADYQAITYQGAQAPGIHAATAYDAMQLVFAAIDQAGASDDITRASVLDALSAVTIDGLTGTISQP